MPTGRAVMREGLTGFEVMTFGRAVMVTRFRRSYNQMSATQRQTKETQAMSQLIETEKNHPAGDPDLVAIKARQQKTWASGDFAVIGTTLQIVGETLCEAADLVAGSRVLDVACGNGNATLAAARRFCRTTGVDYVPELLSRGRERAQAERLPIDFVEGDAEKLPFESASFDAVLSTFGVMFTANQAAAAAELVRVCRPGGTIALASWTPEGFLGDLFRAVTRHVPAPKGLGSPFAWGKESGLRDLFLDRARLVHAERRDFVFRYESAAHFIDLFRTYYGPTHQAFRALDESGQKQLEADLTGVLMKYDRGGARGLIVAGEYLQAVLVRR
jgi:ubiquinone/menaquinone biosynthesis C-methylase UbiE